MGNQTLTAQQQLIEKSVQETFKMFDKDLSGFLEFDEIADLLAYQSNTQKQQIHYQNILKVVNQLDQDRDGRVSKDELKTMMLTKY